MYVCVRERERESVCVCVCERERERVCVSVCVCEREYVMCIRRYVFRVCASLLAYPRECPFHRLITITHRLVPNLPHQ